MPLKQETEKSWQKTGMRKLLQEEVRAQKKVSILPDNEIKWKK